MNTIKHRLPATDYRAAEGISNSSLKWFRKSPAHYKAFLDGKIEVESTRPQIVGTLTHSLVLEGRADFITMPENYIVKTGKCPSCGNESDAKKCSKCKVERVEIELTKPWRKGAEFCDAWEEIQTGQVVSADQAASIRAGANAIKQHPLASVLISNGQPEVSLFASCPKTGLQLKCRADYLKPREIIDLKTAQDASTRAFGRAIASYQYAAQAAFYSYVAQLNDLDICSFYFVALELEPIAMPNVIVLSPSDLEIATAGMHKTLRELAECMEQNEWPGYCQETPNLITLPPWAHVTDEPELIGATEL